MNGGRDWTREAPELLFGGVYAAAFSAKRATRGDLTAATVRVSSEGQPWREAEAPSRLPRFRVWNRDGGYPVATYDGYGAGL
ncbi:MAG: hypothetical protein U1F68_11960 [Gammaproteobacteria bacterium]